MKVNFNTNFSQPAFRASFSNDEKTKYALFKYSKNFPAETLAFIKAVNAAEVDDVIALKASDELYNNKITCINTSITTRKNKNPGFESFIGTFSEKFPSLRLSNGKSVNKYLIKTLSPELQEKAAKNRLFYSDMKKEWETNLIKEARLEHFDKRIADNEDTIQCLKDQNDRIRQLRKDRIQNYCHTRINELI